jgi:hypothetical protein
MDSLAALREGTRAVINANPATIVIKRLTLVNDGMGGKVATPATPVTLAGFTGRLVPSKARTDQGLMVKDSGAQMQTNWNLICPHTADVRHGSDVEDTFTLGGKHYKVQAVIPRAYKGQLYRLVCFLQEVT